MIKTTASTLSSVKSGLRHSRVVAATLTSLPKWIDVFGVLMLVPVPHIVFSVCFICIISSVSVKDWELSYACNS
jgi:hypothetical protein